VGCGGFLHPQYLAGELIRLPLALTAQFWLIAISGAVAATTCYVSAVYKERARIEIFGEAYRRDMESPSDEPNLGDHPAGEPSDAGRRVEGGWHV
jgi:hypothetical protein